MTPFSLASKSQIHKTEYTTAGVIMGIIMSDLKKLEMDSFLIKYVTRTAITKSKRMVIAIAQPTKTTVLKTIWAVFGSSRIFR